MLAWGHVRLFSLWRYLIDRAVQTLLEGRGWPVPEASAYPTGRELVERYLMPLAQVPVIQDALHLATRVLDSPIETVPAFPAVVRSDTGCVLLTGDACLPSNDPVSRKKGCPT
jgi:hypothetical protein